LGKSWLCASFVAFTDHQERSSSLQHNCKAFSLLYSRFRGSQIHFNLLGKKGTILLIYPHNCPPGAVAGMVRFPYETAVASIDQTGDFTEAFGEWGRGKLAVTGSALTMAPSLELLSFNFHTKVFVRDLHPADHVSFQDFPKHNVRNTKGANIHPFLAGINFNLEVQKGTEREVDAFGGFRDRRGFPVDGNKFENHLREHEIIDLILIGNEVMHCVQETALQGIELGFRVWIITDAVGAFTGRIGQLGLGVLAQNGARLISWRQVDMAASPVIAA
jgi:nicotinamidase/pyrazinamidase